MRVIAGQFRGHRLAAPAGRETRPILDRVKVALFDWLGALLDRPGHLPPINVLDLFCGGGSLGIEALSRGARFCSFVEADREAFQCLVGNLDALGIGSAAQASNGPAEKQRIVPPQPCDFDLIFLDPPYALSERVSPSSLMGRVVARLGTEIAVASDALVVWRHHTDYILPDALPEDWQSAQRRVWGNMAITLFERSPQVSS